MIYFSDNELIYLVSADVPYLDNTTFGLQISGNGRVRFYPKKDRIFKIAKTLQNLLEYASATATYTYEMLILARSVQPNIFTESLAYP